MGSPEIVIWTVSAKLIFAVKILRYQTFQELSSKNDCEDEDEELSPPER